ncbi:MAG TPA: hypothetical protein VJV78_45820 [Polyangiales bacterium]|nr:hypothetical protein [Polyangiales bacterium]
MLRGKLLPAHYARYTIAYGVLCQNAGVSALTRIVGQFLIEIAESCEAEGYPPLNALAADGRAKSCHREGLRETFLTFVGQHDHVRRNRGS